MKPSFFIYQDGKIQTTTFADKSVYDICSGPYIVRFETIGAIPVYFCGISDDAWSYLLLTGRIAVGTHVYVDACLELLRRSGKEFGDIKEKTWHDLKIAVEEVKRLRPDIIEVASSEGDGGITRDDAAQKQEGSSIDSQTSDRQKKFRNMLA